jgi:uncharacterized protein (UPF0332 family)
LFDWEEYLRLAEELSSTSATTMLEARYRAAISRTYYACFCSARNFLRDHDRRTDLPRDENVHVFVRDTFLANEHPDRLLIGLNLDRLRTSRNRADYDDVIANPPMTSHAALFLAHEIFEVLHRLQQ